MTDHSTDPISTEDLIAELVAEDPEFAAELEATRPEMELAQIVAQLRLFRGLTQKELGERIDKQQSAIARIENASVNTGWATVSALLDALGFAIHFAPQETDVVLMSRDEFDANMEASHQRGFADGLSSAGTLRSVNAAAPRHAVTSFDATTWATRACGEHELA